jgi:zinc transport system substrate-binding protein
VSSEVFIFEQFLRLQQKNLVGPLPYYVLQNHNIVTGTRASRAGNAINSILTRTTMIVFRPKAPLFASVLLILSVAGCEKTGRPTNDLPASGAAIVLPKNAPVAVSSPFLEAAVREVLCRDVLMVRLAGPSMCPGHFDMRPSQISELAHCGLLVRFDFQQALDEKRRTNSCQTAAIGVHGGLCVPDTYISACRQAADHFVRADFLSRSEADTRLAKLAERMASLRQEVERQIKTSRLHGAPVLASGHQAEFCSWLGLRMVAEISSADSSSVRDLDEALKAGQAAGVRIVVANEPEGSRSADALAERLHARVVVFANFPQPDKELAFDDLVRRNLATLLNAGESGEKRP